MSPSPRAALGGVAEFTPDKGYGARTLGEMKTEGLITYPQPGLIELTAEGRVLAPEPPAYNTLYDAWHDSLTGLHQEVLAALKSVHPEPMKRQDLSRKLNKHFEKGYGARVLGELKTKGVIEYPTPGSLKLTKHVIPTDS